MWPPACLRGLWPHLAWALCLWKHLEQDRALVRGCPWACWFTPQDGLCSLPLALCCLLCILQPASSSTCTSDSSQRHHSGVRLQCLGCSRSPSPTAWLSEPPTAAPRFAPTTCSSQCGGARLLWAPPPHHRSASPSQTVP